MKPHSIIAALVAAPLLFGLPLLLLCLAGPRFVAGVATASVQPVLVDRLYYRKISRPVLQNAQQSLEQAMPEDGENQLWRAELIALLAADRSEALDHARNLVLEGLREDPSNPRGWTLLCEIDVRLKRTDAGACMDTAFYIGPFDWFVARRRSALSAYLWRELDRDTQEAAARRMRIIWENPRMRDIVFDVDQNPNAAPLLTAAFSGDKEELRSVNRWLINARFWGVWRDKSGGPP